MFHSQMALFDYERSFSAPRVLQTDSKLHQIFKEKLFYLRKHYKTILKNVKKGVLRTYVPP